MAEKRKTRKIAVRKNGHVLVKASITSYINGTNLHISAWDLTNTVKKYILWHGTDCIEIIRYKYFHTNYTHYSDK